MEKTEREKSASESVLDDVVPDAYLQDLVDQTKDVIGVSDHPIAGMESFLAMMPRIYAMGERRRQTDPDGYIAHYLERINATRPYHEPFTDLSRAMNRLPLTLPRLRSLDLDPYAEALLLKATTYAAWSRDTEKGDKVLRRTLLIMKHEKSNFEPLNSDPDRFIAAYPRQLDRLMRAYFMDAARHELTERLEGEPITSIEEVIRRWPDITQGVASELKLQKFNGLDTDEDEHPGDVDSGREPESFTPIAETDLTERLSGLALLGTRLRGTFGGNTAITYYMPPVFHEADGTADLREPHISDTADARDAEPTAFISPDYVIAEVTQTLPDGRHAVHAVAESPVYGNATYVLRSDVVESMSDMLERKMTWRDVLALPKVTARQLGARNFRHVGTSDSVGRIEAYFRQPLENQRGRIAWQWIASDSPLYDGAMNATEHSRLPASVRDDVRKRPNEVHAKLEEWIRESRVTRRMGEAGSRAVDTSAHDFAAENEELAAENQRLRAENADLKRRLEAVKDISVQLRDAI